MKKISTFVFSVILFISEKSIAQINEDQVGAWYMYFWNTTIDEGPFGFQGDVQYRNWNLLGDLEQLLLRGGITYSPQNAQIKFTLGYGRISSGEFGEGDNTVSENRIYQEALLPHQVGERFYLTHRFRYEQRWVENQDFRTRYRYNLFLNLPFNQNDLSPGAIYLALYNELFINGQRETGGGRDVELFDRNRFYSAIGYSMKNGLRTQLGYMIQTTDNWAKGQLQVSLHHNIN